MNYETIEMKLLKMNESKPKIKAHSPADIIGICSDMALLMQESFQVLSLNTQNRLINRTLVSLGIANSATVHPRETFRQAIIDNAVSIILVHNHPSGDTTPSAEDIKITRQLVEAGRILEINILDHVIIGRDEAGAVTGCSMRESGLINFN